jgi:hypothetical protein
LTTPSRSKLSQSPKNNSSLKLILFVAYLATCAIVAVLTQINRDQRIDLAVDTHLSDLQRQYDVISRFHRDDAQAIYHSTQNNADVLKILARVEEADEKERDVLRVELHNLLAQNYEYMRLRGVLQYHFVLPDNTTFLRMHKPEKYGDNLGDIRFSFYNTNSKHEFTGGFEQGKTAHAFRNTFPLWDLNGKYLCALDIGYGSETIQTLLTEINHLHTHFLVHVNVFSTKAWERKGIKLEYLRSVENSEYMFAITKEHTPEQLAATKRSLTEAHLEEMKTKMGVGEAFGLYFVREGNAVVISLMPILNIKDKKVSAYLVSYSDNQFIDYTIFAVGVVRIVIFILISMLFVIVYRTICATRLLRFSNTELSVQKQVIEDSHLFITRQNEELTEALAEVKTLSGFLPICASCKKIRDDSGYWNQIETYIKKHSMAEFSHGICPDCAEKMYSDFYEEEK